MTEKQQIAKLTKLIVAIREEHGKVAALLEEVDAILEGKAGIAEKLKIAEQDFDRAWCSRYSPNKGGAYVWRYAMDRPNMKRLLKAIEVADLAQRAIAYVNDSDPYLTRARHPFGLFVTRVNQYARQAAEDFNLAPVSDCRHDPPCSSDQEHTRRKQAELRS